jgi:hypothetical protein
MDQREYIEQLRIERSLLRSLVNNYLFYYVDFYYDYYYCYCLPPEDYETSTIMGLKWEIDKYSQKILEIVTDYFENKK